MKNPIEFYDLKTRSRVQIDEADVVKLTTTRATKKGPQTRYVLKATAPSGGKLTKFVSQQVYDSLTAAKSVE